MANVLAFRDQENLIHEGQAAAAAKPQNQGIRQLQSKTPGQKAPKTPFKIPLNDENAALGGKTGVRPGIKGDENMGTAKKGMLHDKDAFVTPMAGAPRTRAPLGQKTTNAKAKPFQTPGPAPLDHDPAKTKPLSARTSGRRAAPKPARTEPTKLNVLQDAPLEEQEIEYMPPRPEALPDPPDDIPIDFDLSEFTSKPITTGAFHYYHHRPDESGVSLVERERLQDERSLEFDERVISIQIERDLTISTFDCSHEPECSGTCKDQAEAMRKAEQKFQHDMAKLEGTEDRSKQKGADAANEAPAPAPKKDGPSTLTSKRAAAALSMPWSTSAAGAPSYAKPTQAAAAKSTASAQPATRKMLVATAAPAPARNTVTPGVAASRTTVGYAKGRSTSASLHALNERHTASTAPARAGNTTSNAMCSKAKKLANDGMGNASASGAGEDSSLSWLTGDFSGGFSKEDLARDLERENDWIREHALGDLGL